MAKRLLNIGDTVLCYSCERCRIEKRPRDKAYFSGVITKIEGDIATVLNKRGHNLYHNICCLEKITN